MSDRFQRPELARVGENDLSQRLAVYLAFEDDARPPLGDRGEALVGQDRVTDGVRADGANALSASSRRTSLLPEPIPPVISQRPSEELMTSDGSLAPMTVSVPAPWEFRSIGVSPSGNSSSWWSQ